MYTIFFFLKIIFLDFYFNLAKRRPFWDSNSWPPRQKSCTACSTGHIYQLQLRAPGLKTLVFPFPVEYREYVSGSSAAMFPFPVENRACVPVSSFPVFSFSGPSAPMFLLLLFIETQPVCRGRWLWCSPFPL
jgi:hypothetical protein